MASLLGRIWRRDCCCRALILTCGSLLAIGCGGSDPAASVETAAVPEEQSPPPGAPGPAAPTTPETPPAAPGAPGPVEEAPAEPPAPMDPAAPPGEATEVADASAEMENQQAAESEEPSDPAGQATTGSWLAGMAAAVMTPDPNQQSAPGAPGAMPPGAPGAPGAVPGNIPGVAGPAGEMIPGEDGLVPGPATAPGQVEGLPGQMEGVPGQPVAGATKAPAKTFEEGTAEYAVQQLVAKMSAGTTDGMSELINAETKDEILAPLRDGTASPTQIQEAQELVQGIQLSGKREAGSTRLFYARNGAGKSLTFSVRRDDESGDFRVNSLKIEIPRTRRRR